MSGDEAEAIFEQVAHHVRQGEVGEAKAVMREVFAAQDADIKRLSAQLQRLQNRVFGRRTEKMSDEQLRLFQQDATDGSAAESTDDDDAVLTKEEEVLVKEHRRKKRDRDPIDVSGLPVEYVDVPPVESTCGCGKPLKAIHVHETKLIERIPATCSLKIYRRPEMACSNCKGAGVTTAPGPDKPLAGSMLSYSLLVDIIASKFALHLPLNRLRRQYAHEGLVVSVKTMSRWVGTGADILSPLAKEIMKRSLAARVTNTDDTPVTVLDGDAPGGSKKGRLWVYVGDRMWVAFDYTPNWEADRPREMLRRRARGPTQSDGYAGYDAVYEDESLDLYEVGCWSHAKRKVQGALPNDKRAAEPLRLIKQLFRLEALADAQRMTPEQRLAMRNKRSRPIHNKLAACLKRLRKKLAPKDDLALAINYAMNRWQALSRYLDDGHLELTNNIAERHLRRIAVGRANWMFAGSDVGGAWAAILYTVVATAEAFGLNPRNYLRDIMPRLARREYREIGDLLPDTWAKNQTEKPTADS